MLRNCLEGIRVLDFTQIGAGPLATMLLADLGADVIKVEAPEGDVARRLGPPWYRGESPIFIAFNRGKRSICIDLKSEDGRAIAQELAEGIDVIVESFRPGVMERFGLGYETLKQKNARLVYCSLSAYGQTGPYSDRPGIDGIMQAASGLISLIGTEGSEPSKVQAPIVDVFSGYVAGNALLAQLLDRERSGRGGYLDVNLFASALALQQSAITAYLGDGQEPAKLGSAAPYSAPNEAFEASDGWIMIAAYFSDQWPRLCRLLGLQALIDDPRFRTSSDRVVNRTPMRELLSAALKKRACQEWIQLLEEQGIICSKVLTYDEVIEHPQISHLGMIIESSHPKLGNFKCVGSAINSREFNKEPYGALPELGEHTREILRAAGRSEVNIDDLLTRGIVRHVSPDEDAQREPNAGVGA